MSEDNDAKVETKPKGTPTWQWVIILILVDLGHTLYKLKPGEFGRGFFDLFGNVIIVLGLISLFCRGVLKIHK